MVSDEEAATSGNRGKLWRVHRVCENGIETVPTTSVDVVEPSRKGTEMKRKSVTIFDR